MHQPTARLRLPALLLLVAACALTGAFAAAQCSNVWQPGEGLPGFDGTVSASCLWDPDGAGPLGQHLVYGGNFTIAGDIAADHIVARDLVTGEWRTIGAGLPDGVWALHVRPNGELVAGGRFPGQVARWTGAGWQTLGAGMQPGIAFFAEVFAFAELPNGDLVAGGSFFVASGVIANNIARWNGSTWSALGSGLTGNPGSYTQVRSMVVRGNGDLVVTGSFATAGGVAAPNLAVWNGTAWSGLGAGPGVAGLAVHALPGGDLVTGGSSLLSGAMMSRWNGTQWQPFGPTLSVGSAFCMRQLANGDLLVGGSFTSAATRNVLRWDGAAWSGLAGGTGGDSGTILTMQELPGGELAVGGAFLEFGTYQKTNAAIWDGATWSPVAGGFDGVVRAMVRRPNGNLVVAGYFTTAGGAFVGSIAEWNGAAWQPLGAGLVGLANRLEGAECMVTMPGGDLVVGGRFSSAGGVAVDDVARWNGSSWAPLGAVVGNTAASVRAMVVMPNGDLIVGGYFDSIGGVPAANIARWDGVDWSPLGLGVGVPGSSGCQALAVSPDGDLVATGFSQAGGQAARVARWDGTTWTPIGALPQGVGLELLFEPDGDLLVAGTFWLSGSHDDRPLWRWDGQVWSPVGPLMQNGLFALEMDAVVRHNGGDLLAGGTFATAGGVNVPNLARWNGSAWSALGGGTDGRVRAMLQLPDGDVLVGGEFVHAGGEIRPALARLGTTCPALATQLGATCASANGPMVLAVDALPWTGGAFASTCTGVDPAALAFAVFGYTSPGVPLSSLHPAGAPGCVLWASPDASWYQPAIGGVASCSLPIPNDPALVGATLTHQFVEFEFGPGGLTRIGGSDGRTLTIGAF